MVSVVEVAKKAKRGVAGLGQLAIASSKSKNEKTGEVAATYAAQQSCPPTCIFKDAGCYAQAHGHVGMITNRLNATNPNATFMDVVRAEVAIMKEKLDGKRPLRLHVVGDCSSNEAAEYMRDHGLAWYALFNQIVWTYTHAWMVVFRESWGPYISILASCESIKQVRLAFKRGYAAALVVKQHPADGKAYKVDEFTIIPCPEQTGKAKNCASCRLCWNEESLKARKAVIAFATHGSDENKANHGIDVIQSLWAEADADAIAFLKGEVN